MSNRKTPTTKRHKPGPAERARLKAQQEAEARQSAQQDQAVIANMRDRIAKGVLEDNFETRVSEALAEALLGAAASLAGKNAEKVTSYLLAGCEQKDVPSSFRVMNAVVGRLRRMAQDQVAHPLPAAIG